VSARKTGVRTPLFDGTHLILWEPVYTEVGGLDVAYVRPGGELRIVTGAAVWNVPHLPWAVIERVWAQRMLTATDLRPHRIVIREPLRERHLGMLVEAGDLSPIDCLRALAWAAEKHRHA
jgi:hypothetical protein